MNAVAVRIESEDPSLFHRRPRQSRRNAFQREPVLLTVNNEHHMFLCEAEIRHCMKSSLSSHRPFLRWNFFHSLSMNSKWSMMIRMTCRLSRGDRPKANASRTPKFSTSSQYLHFLSPFPHGYELAHSSYSNRKRIASRAPRVSLVSCHPRFKVHS